MAVEKVVEPKTHVKMKFTGHFKGTKKIVQLPVPLISQSQRLEETLEFTRTSAKLGPAFCDVPIEWAGALLAVGGHWQIVDKLTAELAMQIATAKDLCDQKMVKFVLDNEFVET